MRRVILEDHIEKGFPCSRGRKAARPWREHVNIPVGACVNRAAALFHESVEHRVRFEK